MCGINGLIVKEASFCKNIKSDLVKMNDLIIHRGPDEAGFFIEDGNTKSYTMGMCMRRLSIIDLHSGTQPITNDDDSLVIVFNGEIYNYKLLKVTLEKEGVIFKTNSDTEVILRLYEKKGIDAFSMLDGMFAFSIYDKKLDKVFIARDFFGEKPLYYHKSEHGFYWASELKSILKVLPSNPEIGNEGLNLFFQLSYIPAPYTIYKNILKLEANTYLVFDCMKFSFEQHNIEQKAEAIASDLSKKKVIQLNHELVQQSVESRSISDVPLGTFLSGGVDSSIVTWCLAKQTEQKINTFSIGFDKKSFDESEKSQIVAKLVNSNHHEFIVSENSLTTNVDDILLNFDEPFADSSALATYFVANKTKKHVTVALTGDGGDEVYGGYNKYYMGRFNQNYTNIIPEKAHEIIQKLTRKILIGGNDQRGLKFKINRLLKAINYNGDFYYNIISLGFQENEVNELLNNNFQYQNALGFYKEKIGTKNKTLTDFRNIDRVLSLEGDLLVKVDRTSMLTSLECRAPFLNKELWNFTNQLPDNYLIKGWDKKHLLKESFKQYFPKGFLDKSKKGFGVPVGDWLRSIFKQELVAYIEYDFLEKQHLFNIEYIRKLVLNHIEGKEDNTFRVWSFYCFQKWYVHTYTD